ncbi:MAG: hypothetical protein KF688_11095 [Pirellulales bacterium]|nr:hypothetical protein [Pirellulales bacterium]
MNLFIRFDGQGRAARRGFLRRALRDGLLALTCGTCWIASGENAAPETTGPPRPIALHPDNPRYFLWRGKPAILITSGEHYGSLCNAKFDYGRYFQTLAKDGLNHTRTFSGIYRETAASFGITANTLAPAADAYLAPWARSSVPGANDGGNKFDLAVWDERYFRRLDDYMQQASDHGIVVEFTLFCPLYEDDLWRISPLNGANNVNDVGHGDKSEALSLKHDRLLAVQLAAVRKLTTALQRFDNVILEICNEPYARDVPDAWERRIIDEIVATERRLPSRHLISQNVANKTKRIVDPHPATAVFNFHYCTPPDAVRDNDHLDRPIGENETGFRGKEDVLYRTEGWDFILAGGAIYNNLDYSFTVDRPAGDFRQYQSPGGGSPELRTQLGILKRFIESFDFTSMRPDDETVQSVSADLVARTLSEPSKAYAVYLHARLPFKPDDPQQFEQIERVEPITLRLPPGAYQVDWLNPRTGAIDHSESFSHSGGTRELETPPFAADVALKLLRTGD